MWCYTSLIFLTGNEYFCMRVCICLVQCVHHHSSKDKLLFYNVGHVYDRLFFQPQMLMTNTQAINLSTHHSQLS